MAIFPWSYSTVTDKKGAIDSWPEKSEINISTWVPKNASQCIPIFKITNKNGNNKA